MTSTPFDDVPFPDAPYDYDEPYGGDAATVGEELPSLDGILSRLTDAQRRAARATGPTLVLAGAGSGKTLSLVAGVACRIVERRIPPARILAVTFTNKAAGEMRDRIRTTLGAEAPHWLGTFHGLGARMLRHEPEAAGLRPGFDIVDAGDAQRILKRLLAQHRGSPVDADANETTDRKLLKTIGDRIAEMKDKLITHRDAPAHIDALIAERRRMRQACDESGWRLTARMYLLYQDELRTMNAADFGDLVLWPALALQRDEGFRNRWAGRFDAVLADEFQDVNRAQFVFLREMCRAHGELFVVGDDAQSIYSWRGAEIEYIRRFPRDFPGSTVVRLEENFRSTGHILAAAGAVIRHDRQRLDKQLFTRAGDGHKVEILALADNDAEAVAIAQEIGRRAAEGVAYDEMAILYRANRMSRAIEERLLAARIPYTIVGDIGFYQRAVIKDALALLRLSASPESRQSDEAFRRVANRPARGLGAKALGQIEIEANWREISLFDAVDTAALPKATAARLAEFKYAIREAGAMVDAKLPDRLGLLLDRTGYTAMLRRGDDEDAEAALENLAELRQLAEGYGTVTELLEHAALASAGPREAGEGRVQLMTLHRSKGLEFPHVFLPGWNAAVFPSLGADDINEELRLAYVGLTRGMRRVSVLWTRFRDGRPSVPSPFVSYLPEAHCVAGWERFESRQERARPPADRSLRERQMDALGLR